MGKTLKIYEYKGYVAASTDLENGEFINDIKQSGQLGCVVDTKNTEITEKAKEAIKNASREGGSFSALMLTKHSNSDSSSIGVMGFGLHLLKTPSEALTIGRDCDKSILDQCSIMDEKDVPDDFIAFVDKELS